MVIYKATNKINGKVYIGQTVRPLEIRMAEHARHNQTPFDRAIQKYSLDNFDVIVIDRANSVDELNLKEIFWIEFYNALGTNGYNACEGGNNTKGYRHTEQAKIKMSNAKKYNYIGEGNPFFGKHHSTESKKRISETRKGIVFTPEWKQHISENSKQKVKVMNVDTGEIFNSIKEASIKYNIIPTHITRVCRGKRKSTGGYRWKYV